MLIKYLGVFKMYSHICLKQQSNPGPLAYYIKSYSYNNRGLPSEQMVH